MFPVLLKLRTILKTPLLVSLFLAVKFYFMKGYNRSMNQLLSLLNSADSLWEIIPPLVCLVALLVTLPRFLLSFVQSWMQGKKFSKISTDLILTLEQSLTTILTNLSHQSETAQPNEESTTITSLKLPQQDKLLELAAQLTEVLNNEEY